MDPLQNVKSYMHNFGAESGMFHKNSLARGTVIIH